MHNSTFLGERAGGFRLSPSRIHDVGVYDTRKGLTMKASTRKYLSATQMIKQLENSGMGAVDSDRRKAIEKNVAQVLEDKFTEAELKAMAKPYTTVQGKKLLKKHISNLPAIMQAVMYS